IQVIQLCQTRYLRRGKLEYQHAAAGAGDARHFTQCGRLVGDVTQAEADGDAVETVVGKRQLFGVRQGEIDIGRDAAIAQAAAAACQHAGVDVRERHVAVAADIAGKGGGQIPGAAGQIEHVLARAYGGQLVREVFPRPVDAQRHEIVHQVVAIGDGNTS